MKLWPQLPSMDFNLLEDVHRLAFALNEGKYSALKVGIWLGAVISPPPLHLLLNTPVLK